MGILSREVEFTKQNSDGYYRPCAFKDTESFNVIYRRIRDGRVGVWPLSNSKEEDVSRPIGWGDDEPSSDRIISSAYIQKTDGLWNHFQNLGEWGAYEAGVFRGILGRSVVFKEPDMDAGCCVYKPCSYEDSTVRVISYYRIASGDIGVAMVDISDEGRP